MTTIPMTLSEKKGAGALTVEVEARPGIMVPLWPKYYDRISGSLVIASKGFRAAGINPAEPREGREGEAAEAAMRVMEKVGPALLATNPERVTVLIEASDSKKVSAEIAHLTDVLRLPDRSQLELFFDVESWSEEVPANLRYREVVQALAPVLQAEAGNGLTLEELESLFVGYPWDSLVGIHKEVESVGPSLMRSHKSR